MQVYTDGSSQRSLGGCGIVILDPKIKLQDNHSIFIGPATNNQAELSAIYYALKLTSGSLVIYSDSEYSIKAVSVWIKSWKKNNWKSSSTGREVLNKELIQLIDQLLTERENLGDLIEFEHVYGHRGNEYNEVADKLAKKAILNSKNI